METFTYTAFIIFALPLGFILFISLIGAIAEKLTGGRWL